MRMGAALALGLAMLMGLGCAGGVTFDKADTAFIQISSWPGGANVYLSGEKRGTTPYGKEGKGYDITESHRKVGVFTTAPYKIVRKGYIPVIVQYRLLLTPPGERNYKFRDRITLKRIPRAKKAVGKDASAKDAGKTSPKVQSPANADPPVILKKLSPRR